jgi:H+/gluconate symporter-like permease
MLNLRYTILRVFRIKTMTFLMTATPFPTITEIASPLKTSSNTIIVIGAVLGVLILGLLALIFLRRCGGVDLGDSPSEMATASGKEATSGLIPPLFYTDQIADPLMQEDLHEKVAHSDM